MAQERNNFREQLLLAAAGLALTAWWVSPGRNTAKLIEAQGQSLKMMIKVATGVRARDETIIPVIREMSATERAMATAGLHEADRMWIDAMLIGTET